MTCHTKETENLDLRPLGKKTRKGLRVLQVIPDIHPSYGGPAAILRGALPHLNAHNIQCEVVTTCPHLERRGPVHSRSDAEVAAVIHRFPRRNILGWFYAPGLAAWLRDNISRFDVVHIRSLYNYPTLAVSRAASAAGIPRLCETEGSVTAWSRGHKRYKKVPYLWLVERRNALRSEGFLVTHPNEHKDLLRLLPAEHGAIFEHPPPADISTQVCASGSAQRHNLLSMCRLHPKKNLELLLEAYAGLSKHFGPLQIAGSGAHEYERSLRAIASRYELGQNVEFSGHLQGKAKTRALQQARIFTLPSQDENFGIAVVEAVGYGVPVVASDAVNAAHALADAGFARLFPAGNLAELQRTLRQAWNDTIWQQRVTEHGPDFVRERYAPDTHAARLAQHYRELVNGQYR